MAISTVATPPYDFSHERPYLSQGWTVTCTSGSTPRACGERRKAPAEMPGDAKTEEMSPAAYEASCLEQYSSSATDPCR